MSRFTSKILCGSYPDSLSLNATCSVFRFLTKAKQFAFSSSTYVKHSIKRCNVLHMCRRRESNPHPLRDTILSRARLPIPPLRHVYCFIIVLNYVRKINKRGLGCASFFVAKFISCRDIICACKKHELEYCGEE